MSKNPRKAGKIPLVLLAMTLTENTPLYAINFGTDLLSGLFLIDHLIDVVVFIAIAHAQAEEQHRLGPNCRP